ncbi:MAG: MMPL family transporter, partial [Actinobacteria bacterium]|nr:MMPL family transporter [Actinomycetota bacterium]
MLERWTKAIIRRRFAVLACWLVLGMLGTIAASHLNEHLTTSLTVPDSESAMANQLLAEKFGDKNEGTFTIFYKFKDASNSEINLFKSEIVQAASVIPTAKVTQQKALGGVLFASVSTSLSLTKAASYTDLLRQTLISGGLTQALVTGPPAIYRDVTPVLAQDLHRGQKIAGALALILLILILGFSWAVAIPFIFAAATITLALGAVFLLAQKFLMVFYIPNIIELIGLGLAIDYSLLIVHRFRRELLADDEMDVDSAIVATMETAGRTVLLSGSIVGIGLALLLFVPVPFVRSLGMAGLLVPTASLLAALTLQPALLSLLGRKGISSHGFRGLLAKRDLSLGLWARIARFVIRRPIAVFLSSLAILGLLASAVTGLLVTPSSLTTLPANLQSARALAIATDKAGPGVISPHQIVIDLGAPELATTPSVRTARTSLASAISKNAEVLTVAMGEKDPYVDITGQYLRMFVIGKHELGAVTSQKLVKELRNKYLPEAKFGMQSRLYLGGEPAQGSDLLRSLFGTFPWIVLVVLLVAYLLLLRAFKSLFLPLKAIFMDLISISVAYGLMVLVFRRNVGSDLLGTYHLDQIEAWVLIFLFAVLFGLSMDYEVFMVSRMREAWESGATNEE